MIIEKGLTLIFVFYLFLRFGKKIIFIFDDLKMKVKCRIIRVLLDLLKHF